MSLRRPPEPLTREEVERLLAVCSRRAPTGVRNRALIALLYRTGLRISEALALRPVDVDAGEGTVHVLHGKGDRSRVVGIDSGALALLERWLDVRCSRGIARTAPVFCTLGGQPLATKYVRAFLPRLARRAGIEKRVHAHGLRHTHAVELVREGVPLPLISRQLGHSSSAVTARYIDHVAPLEVIETIRSRTWEAPAA
jgi:site-specific recombinase XerD